MFPVFILIDFMIHNLVNILQIPRQEIMIMSDGILPLRICHFGLKKVKLIITFKIVTFSLHSCWPTGRSSHISCHLAVRTLRGESLD